MTSQQFQLIDGTFAKRNALFIILSFFNEKIAHHNRELLRIKESNGDTKPIEDKLISLHETSKRFNDYLSSYSDATKFQLSGSIYVDVWAES
ncbi:MAG TPA: hypothetical protein VHB54_01010 [Mucilaginibacter sp.]|nr:hypothetical protein [Mucilaginibacter sp.]